MNRLRTLKWSAGILILSASAYAMSSGLHQINRQVVNAAGGNMASGVHKLSSSVGEPMAGFCSNTQHKLMSGYMQSFTQPTPAPMVTPTVLLPPDRRAWAVHNRFRPGRGEQTTIEFRVTDPNTRVEIKLYNLSGEYIKTLVNQEYGPGEYRAPWNGCNLAGSVVASGIYLIRVKIGNNVQVIKTAVIK